MNKRFLVFIGSLFFLCATTQGVQAEKIYSAENIPDFIGTNTETVENYIKAVRSRITELRLLDGSNVHAETEEELKKPIIPYEDSKRIVNRGIITAMAEYCNLGWQENSFVPFMEKERRKGVWSDKQMAFIGAMHGVTQSSFHQSFISKGPCNETFKQNAATLLKK